MLNGKRKALNHGSNYPATAPGTDRTRCTCHGCAVSTATSSMGWSGGPELVALVPAYRINCNKFRALMRASGGEGAGHEVVEVVEGEALGRRRARRW